MYNQMKIILQCKYGAKCWGLNPNSRVTCSDHEKLPPDKKKKRNAPVKKPEVAPKVPKNVKEIKVNFCIDCRKVPTQPHQRYCNNCFAFVKQYIIQPKRPNFTPEKLVFTPDELDFIKNITKGSPSRISDPSQGFLTPQQEDQATQTDQEEPVPPVQPVQKVPLKTLLENYTVAIVVISSFISPHRLSTEALDNLSHQRLDIKTLCYLFKTGDFKKRLQNEVKMPKHDIDNLYAAIEKIPKSKLEEIIQKMDL